MPASLTSLNACLSETVLIACVTVGAGVIIVVVFAVAYFFCKRDSFRRRRYKKSAILSVNARITAPPDNSDTQRRRSVDAALKPQEEEIYNIRLFESPSKDLGHAGTTWGDLHYDTIQNARGIPRTETAWEKPVYELLASSANSEPRIDRSGYTTLIAPKAGHAYEIAQ